MPPLLLTLLWLLPLRTEGKRIRVYAMTLLGALGAEIEARRWAMTEADLYAFDARLCALEEGLARRLMGVWPLLRARGDIVDAASLKARCAALWALVFSAAETRPKRPPRRRGLFNRGRRNFAVTNRRRTPAYRRRRLRRPAAAALEFSG